MVPMDMNVESPLPERNTGTTLTTGPISQCCLLVPGILNSLPSSMAVELFIKTQKRHTSSLNVFFSKRDVNSTSSDFVHSVLYAIFFLFPFIPFFFFLFFIFPFFFLLSLYLSCRLFFYLLLLYSRLLK